MRIKRFVSKRGFVDIYNTNKLSSMQVADELVQKIIFPYLNFNDKTVLIEEDEFRKSFPKAYKYLKSNKDKLALRDKGKGSYTNWYSYGRTQSLQDMEYKLFFPKYSSSTPYFIINEDSSVKFYNGLALIGESLKVIEFARLIMQTRIILANLYIYFNKQTLFCWLLFFKWQLYS